MCNKCLTNGSHIDIGERTGVLSHVLPAGALSAASPRNTSTAPCAEDERAAQTPELPSHQAQVKSTASAPSHHCIRLILSGVF